MLVVLIYRNCFKYKEREVENGRARFSLIINFRLSLPILYIVLLLNNNSTRRKKYTIEERERINKICRAPFFSFPFSLYKQSLWNRVS